MDPGATGTGASRMKTTVDEENPLRRHAWLFVVVASLSLALTLAGSRSGDVLASPTPPRSFALVSGLGGDAVTVVDATRRKVVRIMPVHDREDVAEVAPARQGRRFYVLDQGTRIRAIGPRSQIVYATWTLPRRPLPPEQPVLTLSDDERWLFVRSGQAICAPRQGVQASTVWALDLRESRWVPVRAAGAWTRPPRVVAGAHGRTYAVTGREAVEMRFDGTAFVPGRRTPLPYAFLSNACAGANGATLYAVGSPMARKPCRLVAWTPDAKKQRVVNLEGWLSPLQSENARSLVSASPDGQWLVVLRDRWVLFLRPDTLAVEDRVWLDGSALAAAFTLDSQDLLIVLEQGKMVRVRAGDRHLGPVADGLLQRDAGARLVVAPAAW